MRSVPPCRLRLLVNNACLALSRLVMVMTRLIIMLMIRLVVMMAIRLVVMMVIRLVTMVMMIRS